jgi:hypothetical protein
LEYKLTLTLDVPYIQTYQPLISLPPDIHYNLISTIRLQNIIGWVSFLRGFIASSWMTLFDEITNYDPPVSHRCPSKPWDNYLTELSLSLYKGIWTTRNNSIHGSTKAEASLLQRQRVIREVHSIYANPPSLAKRFPKIRSVPLNQRLKKNTGHLQR